MQTPGMAGEMVVDVRAAGTPIRGSPVRMRIGGALALQDKALDVTQLEWDDCGDVCAFAVGPNDNIAAVHGFTDELALVSSDCTRELWRVKVC